MTFARRLSSAILAFAGIASMTALAPDAHAQLHDLAKAPNPENEGIAKSLIDQIGAGRGDVLTPGSSIFIIKRDPARAIRRGRQLFQRKFGVSEGVGPLTGDGTGPIAQEASIGAGLADSCASCHGRPRGSAGFGGDVFTRPDSRDAPHLFGLGLQEQLAEEITEELRAKADAAQAQCQQGGFTTHAFLRATNATQNDPAPWIDYGRVIFVPPACNPDTSEVVGVDPDLRVRPFFVEGGTISMREFLVGAFNAEMGLESPDPDMLAAVGGAVVTTPSGMVLDGTRDAIEAPPVSSPLEDSDNDGVVNEIPTSLVDFMEFYLLNYFKPGRGRIDNEVLMGEFYMGHFGCTNCHVKDLTIGSDRRVADVETVFSPPPAGTFRFNRLFATASLRLTEQNDGSGFPTIKNPQNGQFIVRNIHTDFKRHNLGRTLHELNFDSSLTTHVMTEPLWGVGSTAPYGHDGRSMNLDEIILRHAGQGAEGIAIQAVNAWNAFGESARVAVRKYLNSLILFPPDDTASNLNPGDPTAAAYPQRGHGSINLGALFNVPPSIDPE